METSAEPSTVQGENGIDTGSATGTATVPGKKPKKTRINYGLAGTLFASGMDWAEIAPRVGAKTGETVRVGMFKRGVTKRSVRALPGQEARILTVAAKSATVGADMIREKLGGQLGQSVDALASVPTEYPDLASKGQGRAAVLKTLAETHKLLFGGSESTVLVFGVDQIAERALEPVIDVTSTVQTQPD